MEADHLVLQVVVKDSGFYSEKWHNLTYSQQDNAGCSVEVRLKRCNDGTSETMQKCLAMTRMTVVMGVRSGLPLMNKRIHNPLMNIYFKVELTRYLDGLDGSCGRKKRDKNDSSFGISRWKDKVVINCYGAD